MHSCRVIGRSFIFVKLIERKNDEKKYYIKTLLCRAFKNFCEIMIVHLPCEFEANEVITACISCYSFPPICSKIHWIFLILLIQKFKERKREREKCILEEKNTKKQSNPIIQRNSDLNDYTLDVGFILISFESVS